jgi:hypothetical protein
VAVSASNYLIFVLGFTDLLAAVGVYYELARIIAACCEGVYLYCMMRWVVFRDAVGPDAGETVSDTSARPATASAAGPPAEPTRGPTAEPAAGSGQEPTEPVFGPAARPS